MKLGIDVDIHQPLTPNTVTTCPRCTSTTANELTLLQNNFPQEYCICVQLLGVGIDHNTTLRL